MTAGSGTHSPAAGAVFLLRFQPDALQRTEPRPRAEASRPHISGGVSRPPTPFFLP